MYVYDASCVIIADYHYALHENAYEVITAIGERENIYQCHGGMGIED